MVISVLSSSLFDLPIILCISTNKNFPSIIDIWSFYLVFGIIIRTILFFSTCFKNWICWKWELISNYLNLNEIITDHYLLENVFLLLWHFQLFLYCYWQLKISIKIMHFEGDIGWSWPCEIWLRTSDSQLSVNLDSFSLKRKVFSLYS